MSFISYFQKKDKIDAIWQKRIDQQQEKIDQLEAISSSNPDVIEMVNQRLAAENTGKNFFVKNQAKNNAKFDYTGTHLASLNSIDTRFNQQYRDQMVEFLDLEDRDRIEAFLDQYKDANNDTDRELLIRGALGLDLI